MSDQYVVVSSKCAQGITSENGYQNTKLTVRVILNTVEGSVLGSLCRCPESLGLTGTSKSEGLGRGIEKTVRRSRRYPTPVNREKGTPFHVEREKKR